MIDRGLARDLRVLDELLQAELVTRAAPEVARLLGALAAAHRDGGEHAPAGVDELQLPAPASPVLAEIARRFGLNAVDRLLLLLAVAPELDGRYAHVFAALNDVSGLARPTIGLAQTLIRGRLGRELAVIDRVLPSRPLGRYGLVAVEGAAGAVHRCLAAPLDVMTWFADGHDGERAAVPAAGPLALAPGVETKIAAAAAWIGRQLTWTAWVHGPPGSGRAAVARAIVAATGARAMSVPASELATRGAAALLRAAAWADAVLVIEDAEVAELPALRELASTALPLIVTSRPGALTALLGDARPCLDVAVPALPPAVRAEIWRARLGDVELDADGIAERHRLGPERIGLAARRARAQADAAGTAITRAGIDAACRDLTTGRLADLGHHLELTGASDVLVLGPAASRELSLAVTWARHSRRALERGGATVVGMPDDHLVCLFHGPPGTGKTLAARALAERLGLEAYRIDLSQLVSKWIGETEKNLARLFDEAEAANAILFFDEADALFARRTEVKDAHDRFANIEAGYLLQRVEEHRGVVVLATNFMRNLDGALLRRCQVLVGFQLPGPEQRREIWRRCLGRAAEAIDLDFIAGRFDLSGGDIRNAAMTALLLAEARGGPLTMEDVAIGTWRELDKAGRIVTREDFGPLGDAAFAYALAGRNPGATGAS